MAVKAAENMAVVPKKNLMCNEQGYLVFEGEHFLHNQTYFKYCIGGSTNKRTDEEVEEMIKKFTASGELKFKQHFYYESVRRGLITETVPLREKLGFDAHGIDKWKRPNTEVIKRGDIVILTCYFKITFSKQGAWVSLIYTPNMILRVKDMGGNSASNYCFVSSIVDDVND